MIVRILNKFGLFTKWQVNNMISVSVRQFIERVEATEKLKTEFQNILEKDRNAILTFISRAEDYAYSTNNTELQ